MKQIILHFQIFFRERLSFIFVKNSRFGRLLWITSGILFYFFLNCIVSMLLSPFNFLPFFMQGIYAVIFFVLAIVAYFKGFKWFAFFDSLPLYKNGFILVMMLLIYYFSLNYLWKNRTNIIAQNQQ